MPRNLSPEEREEVFGPLVVEPEVIGRDTVQFRTPPGPPPLVAVQFGPHTVHVHEKAAASLEAIAAELEADGLMPLIETIVGFQPRLVRTAEGGNKPVLSAHAYGAAVDVNAADLPQGSHTNEQQRGLAPYFEGHGWFWGENFTDSPDPHHFVFQGTDPTLAEQGLTCPVNRQVWGEEHSIALVPGMVQRWLVGIVAPSSSTEEDLGRALADVFTFWAPLFPGSVQVPNVRLATAEERAMALDAIEFEFGSPLHFVYAEFGYRGASEQMPVPTFLRRRRDRIEPTCPVPPIHVAPVLALEPEDEADFSDPRDTVPGSRPPALEDPLDVLDEQIDTDELARNLRAGFDLAKTVMWFAGAAVAAGLLWKLTQASRRR